METDRSKQTLKAGLIEKAALCCEHLNIKQPTLGKKLANDGKFFSRISAGGTCTLEVYERLMDAMDEILAK